LFSQHFKILYACTNAQHNVATTESVLVIVVQIGVLFSELIGTGYDGLLALCNSQLADSCQIPNA